MAAPLIGLSMYRETASWGAWKNVPASLLPHAYVESVTRAAVSRCCCRSIWNATPRSSRPRPKRWSASCTA